MKKILFLVGFYISVISISNAQVNFTVADESTMTITGTSTIHDWTSTVNEIKGTYQFKEDVLNKKMPESGEIVDNLKMIIPVLSIESPRGATMDNKTYNALNSEEHPHIIFNLKSDKIVGSRSNSFQIAVNGDLTIAGHTKNINLTMEGERIDNNGMKFKGSYPIDMVAYDIDPPSAMFGQIKTGKDVTIDFELTLIKE